MLAESAVGEVTAASGNGGAIIVVSFEGEVLVLPS
jgi:hypothetical protein